MPNQRESIIGENLENLIYDLGYNYFVGSVRGDSNSQSKDLKRKIFSDESVEKIQQANTSTRNIIVVGAGASKASYSDLSTGEEAIPLIKERLGHNTVFDRKRYSELKEDYKRAKRIADETKNRGGKLYEESYSKKIKLKQILKNYDYLINKFEEESSNIKTLFRFKNDLDFESNLALLSNIYSSKDLKQIIQDIYGKRFFPSSIYEIITHLLKHRFVDAVVNFNFDELLDQSIEEHMKGMDFKTILSDGDCEEFKDELIIDSRLKKPLYIKPHGTASHKSSLRFTKSHYLGIPNDINELLGNLFSGQLDGDKRVETVNIISIGFNMESIEFNNMLANAYKSRLDEEHNFKIRGYIFEFEKTDAEKTATENFETIFKGLKENGLYKNEAFKIRVTDKGETSLENLLISFWHKLSGIFSDKYSPRGVTQHLLIADIFKGVRALDLKRKEIDELLWLYALLRTVSEIIISVFVHKGTVKLSHLINSRTGIYYKLYSDSLGEESSSSYKVTIHEILEKIGLIRDDYFDKQFYTLPGLHKEIESKTHNVFEHIFESIQFEGILELVASSIKYKERNFEYDENQEPNLLKERIKEYLEGFEPTNTETDSYFKLLDNFISKEFSKHYKEDLEKIFEISSYDVRPKFNEKWHFLFDNHHKEKILNTRLSWKLSFHELLERENWNRMLMTSERGSVFKKNYFKKFNNQYQVKLILTSPTYNLHSHPFFKDNPENEIRYIPQWGMRHHISVFFKKLERNEYSYISLSDISFEKSTNDFESEWEEVKFYILKEGKMEQANVTLNNINPQNKSNYYLAVKGWVPLHAIYFKLHQDYNEVSPILVESDLSTSYDHKELLKKDEHRIWDPDLVYLSKKFFQYYSKSIKDSANSIGFGFVKSKIDRTNYHGDFKFFEWLNNNMKPSVKITHKKSPVS